MKESERCTKEWIEYNNNLAGRIGLHATVHL